MFPPVEFAVEGATDIPAAIKLISYCGGVHGSSREMRGAPNLQRSLAGYNAAANRNPWLVLRDLDADPCPAELAQELVPTPATYMCLRIPVRAVEAWYLADADALADFLGVSSAIMPREPELLPRPKRAIVDIARKSNRREIVRALIPREGAGREVGPGYAGQIITFAQDAWSIDRAIMSGRVPSLAKAAVRLKDILHRYRVLT